MNTTAKGDSLEDNVYSLFSTLISENNFLAKKEFCKIYRKKGYHSKDRGKDIIFDISIEITFPNLDQYSILVLIECKNYNHRVPVDDVEEFFQKTQQISGGNVKGFVVSTNSFQESAFNFSQSKGIGLIRYYDKNSLDWILARSPSGTAPPSHGWINAHHGLHDEGHTSRYYDCYGFASNIYTNSLRQFLRSLITNNLEKEAAEALRSIETPDSDPSNMPPFIAKHEIEGICTKTLFEHGYTDGQAPIEEICQSISENKGLTINRNKNLPKGILGTISFHNLTINIDDVQAGTEERLRFTLAHELGHLLLSHQHFMHGESCHADDVEIDDPKPIEVKAIARMEWQANYFSSCLLLPREPFSRAFLREAKKRNLSNKGYGLLYLDRQKCNIESFYNITSPLMTEFSASRSAIKIRLKELGYLGEEPPLWKQGATGSNPNK